VDNPLRHCWERYLKEHLDAKCTIFNAQQMLQIDFHEVLDFDGIIISGSPSSVYEDKKWIRNLEHLVIDVIKYGRTPLVGGCFGHQLIAQALGGKVTKNPKEFGNSKFVLRNEFIEFLDGYFEQPFALEFTPDPIALESHGDQVVEMPPGAICLATSKSAKYEMFCIPKSRVLAFQFHPEIMTQEVFDRILPRFDSNPDYIFKEHSSERIEDNLKNVNPTAFEFAMLVDSFIRTYKERRDRNETNRRCDH